MWDVGEREWQNRKLTCVLGGLGLYLCMQSKKNYCVTKLWGFCFLVGIFLFLLWSPLSCLWDQVSSIVIGSHTHSLFESLLRRAITDNPCWRWGLEATYIIYVVFSFCSCCWTLLMVLFEPLRTMFDYRINLGFC